MPQFNGQNKKKIDPRYFSEELLEETGTRKEEIQRALKEQTRNGYAGRGAGRGPVRRKHFCADPAMEGEPHPGLSSAICRGGRVVRVSEAEYNKAIDGSKRGGGGDGEDRREKGPGRTRGEEAAMRPLQNTQAWAKQLTPVKYRQLIEDVKNASAQPRTAGRWIQKYAAAAMAGKVTAQQAARFEKTFEKFYEALGDPIVNSGYPGVHTA